MVEAEQQRQRQRRLRRRLVSEREESEGGEERWEGVAPPPSSWPEMGDSGGSVVSVDVERISFGGKVGGAPPPS